MSIKKHYFEFFLGDVNRKRRATHIYCTCVLFNARQFNLIFKVQFFSNKVTIFALTFRFKAQQCNDKIGTFSMILLIYQEFKKLYQVEIF